MKTKLAFLMVSLVCSFGGAATVSVSCHSPTHGLKLSGTFDVLPGYVEGVVTSTDSEFSAPRQSPMTGYFRNGSLHLTLAFPDTKIQVLHAYNDIAERRDSTVRTKGSGTLEPVVCSVK